MKVMSVKAKQRVLIAKDIIKQIKAKKFRTDLTVYFEETTKEGA